ncbi:DsrE family protein [Rosistilla oblonga]|uniref:DsrE family protein n=1 Tax=Rosistilla oblonga TaxID=2527990 RepID=UPI003A97F838
MKRSIPFLSISILGLLAIATASAQHQSGERRGVGFGGGRGAGLGHGKGMRRHPAADKKTAEARQLVYPVIANHGGVVHLPDAAQQPRAGTKLVVDLTSGGDPGQLNAGVEKLARYLNIYAGAGAKPAAAKIAVVFHGGATLAVLNEDAYTAKFKTASNPNLKLLRQLHDAGVELFVCGQALNGKGSAPDEVVDFIDVAVSALTAIVNLQSDGYAYIPLAGAAPKASPELDPASANESDNSKQAGPVGHGHGHGNGGKHGGGGMQGDMKTLHAMFDERSKIKRTVTNLPDGAEAVTESDDEAVTLMIQNHVAAMEERVLGNKPLPPMTFHPIFVALLKHADDYTFTYTPTEKGIRVKYQSDDPYVVMLVQEHAKLISRFIKNGMAEVHAPYTLPTSPQEPNADGRK